VKNKLLSRPLVGVLVLLAAVLVAVGCGDDDGGGGTSAGDLGTITEGKLRVGSDIPYAPFEFGRAPDYEGFDVDIVNEIAKRLDVEAEFVKTPFDPIFRNLAQGRFDIVASAATITPERQRTVNFSEPYFPADQSLMVKRGSDIKTVDDVEGKRVGAQLGTTGAAEARKLNAESVRTYDLIDDAFNALQNDQVDAVINDFPVSKYAERSKKDLQVVQRIATGEEYGIGINKDDTKLKEEIDKALQDMKEDGTYTRIYKKWFQEDPPDSIFNTGPESAGQGDSNSGSGSGSSY
jgi:polar amino acid transport system substrate-binding protein